MRVNVVDPGGTNPISGYTAYALHEADGSCLVQSRALTPAGASTQSLALPPGSYLIALSPTATTGVPVTLTLGEPVPTVTVRSG